MRKSKIIVKKNSEDENIENLAYENYSLIKDFSLFINISIYTCIY